MKRIISTIFYAHRSEDDLQLLCFSAHAVEAVPAVLQLFYNCFSALGGRRAGVCVSADSAGRCNNFLV
jgi:hypothetical protein